MTTQKPSTEERVVACARTERVRLIILQGAQGTGKSNLASRLSLRHPKVRIVSADHYMVNSAGDYEFDRNRLAGCHQKCQNAAHSALKEGFSVIVDNCNARKEHIAPYVSMIGKHEKFVVVHLSAQLTQVPQLFARCVHNVPDFAIRNTLNSIERLDFPNACYITEDVAL